MFKKFGQLITAFSILFTLMGGFLVVATPTTVYAQSDITDSLDTTGEASGLGNADIKVTIAKFIRAFLAVLGIIAVILVLYGGFVWMTAGGDGEKVEKAKKILINAGVGLFIIMASYSITTFVLSALLDATGGSSGSSSSSGSSGTSGLGGGSSTTFAVSAFSPEGEVSIRNIKLSITFSRNVDEDTVDGNLIVTNSTTGEEVEGTITVRGNKVSFVPTATCPEPNEDRYCFDENTTYEVEVTEDIESTASRSLDCSAVSCISSFTSGELVDTEDPKATVSYPDDGDRISVDSSTTVQAAATDDSEISTADFYGAEELFDSVAASGDDLSDVTIESTWYTDDLSEGTRYTLEVIVEDIAGNTDSDSIRILAEAWHCSNETKDEDEEGKDCGGEDCGACDGSSCEEDSDCSSETCEEGTCVSYPEISGISPEDGAVGTYVTISGEGFGSSGSVYFVDSDGADLEADVPSCADWGDTEIVVEVPEGAVDGPITVETSKGYTDSTDDDNGELFDDFDVNDTVRPSLCKATPDSGKIGASVAITGVNFGSSQSDSEVNFDTTEAGSYTSWSATSIKVTVPTVTEEETYSIVLTVGGVESNALSFDVLETVTDKPTISYISPEDGGKGQYVTIFGSNFGSRTGTVYFKNDDTGYTAAGSADFPTQCDTDFWSDTQITIIVPDEYSNGNNLATGTHKLYIVTQPGTESASTEFTVTSADPTPGICKLDPDSGEEGDTITIYGEKFGSSEGSVEFYNGVAATVSEDGWSTGEITVTVPSGVATGPMTLTSSGGEVSNKYNFEVSSADSSTTDTSLSGGYAWYFSTGEIPEVPELLIACDYDANIISGVPNKKFTNDVCTTAVVYGTFSTLMNTDTLAESVGNITVSECTDTDCKSTTEIEGATIETSSSTTQTSFTWKWPTGSSSYNSGAGFKNSTTYQVLVAEEVESESGENMDGDVSWTFTTGTAGNNCDIEEIILSPNKDTITEEGGTTEFQALPSGQCQVYNGATYEWNWDIDPGSYASLNAGKCDDISDDSCAVATALNEGESAVYAEEIESGVIGAGTLVVDYTDPYVSAYWPSCNTACINASVGASFNIPMSSSVSEGFSLFKCANELCVSLDEITVIGSCTDEDTDSETGEIICSEVQIIPTDDLEKDTYYRVIVSGDVSSSSGVALTRTNYGDDFSWIFSTKDDDTICSVDRVDLTPDKITLSAIGDTQQYFAQPYGEPDSCSVAGQKLNAYSYNWDWAKPFNDSDVALIRYIGSSYADSDITSIPDGCTTSCLATGSSIYVAVCGDSSIGTGEDCDDGNATNGDGCSSSCLREGASGSYGTCGDGVVDQGSNKEGEDCDDGNSIDGDGCSSKCLREGSTYVGATCGNSSVAQDEFGGGEDCDDGNRKSGDGCSAQCLNEGTTAQADIESRCGDGDISTPYETCDDGNATDGDGCSSSCLREGSYGSIGTCGNGIAEKKPASATVDNSGGEDCDGTSGCDDNCLFAGSSLTYSNPSVCGDGKAGMGELAICEASASGDGKIDPVQLAIIIDSAAEQVDEDTRLAETTIKATYEDEYDTAKLYLECSAEEDDDCKTGYGPADNQCCMVRPEVTSLYPTGNDVCRNTAFYATFNTQMDLNTFIYKDDDETVSNVYIKYETYGGCPSGYEEVAYSSDFFSPTWFAGLWSEITSLFGAQVNAQTSVECLVPITNIKQTSQEDGTYKVSFQHNTLLEENGNYSLYITGGTTGDSDHDGVLSKYGVEMDGDSYVDFITGTELCTLDTVDVNDTDSESPNLYTATNEEHEFTATPYSFATGSKEEIESIDDVYSWAWASWKADDDGIILKNESEDGTGSIALVTYSAIGENGEVDITASATITSDVVNSSTGDTVSGATSVVVLLCENIWPSIEDFPFIDDATGTVDGIEEGAGWMNFSMYYCRDFGTDGDLTDDLPQLNVVSSGSIGTEGVIKEYFFAVESDGKDTGDAVGIRIAQNEDYLSPYAWYQSQGFAGSPTEIQLDGYQAIQDGRTVYGAVTNENGGVIYPNIFVFSYNDGASTETINIFSQMLATLNFNTNMETTSLCSDGTSYTDDVCQSNLDCSDTEICGDEVAKLQRDMERLTDVTTAAGYIDSYQAANSGQTPQLEAGTYVSPISASAWLSWNETLSSDLLIALSTDPVNGYETCSSSSDYNYDSATCVDQTKGVYACSEGSYIYHYRAYGNDGYYLTAELEYTNSDWYYDIDDDETDDENILIGASSSASAGGFSSGAAFCDGSIYGSSTTCGDGVIGGSEFCEIGDINYESYDSDGDGKVDCKLTQNCNSTCTAYETDESVECSAFDCGNGVVETWEVCDDGSYNGKYGYCGSLCTYDSSFYCGDGSIAGSEVCDCGKSTASTVNSGYGGTACVGVNNTYNSSAAGTCAWDCSEPGPYCGDSVIDSSEECDSNTETWAGALCADGTECSKDSDCSFGSCGDGGNACGNSQICIGGDSDISCTTTTTEYADEAELETFCSSSVTGANMRCQSDRVSGTTETGIEFTSYETTCSSGEYIDIGCETECDESGEACDTTCEGIYYGDYGYEGSGLSCAGVSGTAVSCSPTCTTDDEGVICDTSCETADGEDASCTVYCEDDPPTSPGESIACEVKCYPYLDSGERVSCSNINITIEVPELTDSLFCETTLDVTVISEDGETTVCSSSNGAGDPCDSNSDCSSGVCSTQSYDLYRYKSCSETECTLGNWSSCVGGSQTCGDGQVDGDEECDDGNSDSTDSCTNECTVNVCGDGYIYDGEEQCDDGDENGDICSSSYESSCTYCNDSCKEVTSSGNFCGDGEINGSELCDGEDLAYHYYYSVYGVYGTCTYEEYRAGGIHGDKETGYSYVCTKVGICNGGDENGEYCQSGSDCSSGKCVVPACASDCESMCPFTYDSADITMKTNLVGAKQKSEVILSSYSETSGSSRLSYGNSATMYIPACRAATGLTADVEFSFNLPTPYVLFVNDMSTSMSDSLGSSGSKISVLKDVLSDSVGTLYDEVDDVKIGLVAAVSAGCGTATGYGTGSDYEDDVDVLEFTSASSYSSVESEINSYSACGGTYTYSGLFAARTIMKAQSDTNKRKVVVLLTDGDWADTSAWDGGTAIPEAEKDPLFMACKLKEDGVEVFTVLLDSGTTTITSIDQEECSKYDGYEYFEDFYADEVAAAAAAACVNGTVDAEYSEECDDGNSSNFDECTTSCEFTYCGDGTTQNPNGDSSYGTTDNGDEECDGAGETAGCDYDCTDAVCGDGYINDLRGEECDDGDDNGEYGDMCSSDCELTTEEDLGTDGIDDGTTSAGSETGVFDPFISGFRLVWNSINQTSDSWIAAKTKHTIAAECSDGADSLSITEEMACWSSGNPNEEEGIDYAFSGDSTTELAAAYEEIVNTLIGAQITYVVDGDSVLKSLKEGSNISLPWPEGFECDEDNESEVPFRISFDGTGTVTISDVTLQYCEP